MTYLLAATVISVLGAFAGWWTRGRRATAAATDATVRGSAATRAGAADETSADVATSVTLALKRLREVITCSGVGADVAVPPGLMVGVSDDTLADLLEEVLTNAIHHARASRLLVTAVGDDVKVCVSVTDNAGGADPALRAECFHRLANRMARRGEALEIDVRPGEGTTITLVLAAAKEPTNILADHAIPDARRTFPIQHATAAPLEAQGSPVEQRGLPGSEREMSRRREESASTSASVRPVDVDVAVR